MPSARAPAAPPAPRGSPPPVLDYVEISIAVIDRIAGALPFDVYVKRLEGTYTRLFPKGEQADTERLRDYREAKGVQTLWVKNDEYQAYLLYVDQVTRKVLEANPPAPAPVLAEVVQEMVHLTMLELSVKHRLDARALGHASQSVRGCLDLLGRDPKSFIHLLRLMARHPYGIRHALSTSVISLMLARHMGLEADKTLMTVGLGGLLHDIGMSMLPFDAETKESLTAEEWKQVKEHPELGKRMLDSIPAITGEVRMIVLQHHEQPNGRGYPNHLSDRQIYALAQIVSVTDSFTSLLSNRPFRGSSGSAAQALALMTEDIGKFDPALLDGMAQIFLTVKTP